MIDTTCWKAKYRIPGKILHRQFDPPQGTGVYSAGRFTSKGSNSGKAQKPVQGNGHRRRQGLGATARD